MSDFEFVLVHGNDFNLQTNVFEFVVGGGRGTPGVKGDTGDTGEGVPAGGSAGDSIVKESGIDFAFIILKNNLAAIIAPTVTDDSGSGYAVKSLWFDTILAKVYQCLDASVGAAVWADLTASGGGGGEWTEITKTEVLVAASSVDFLNVFTDAYDTYRIRIEGARPSGGADTFYFTLGYGVVPTWVINGYYSHLKTTRSNSTSYSSQIQTNQPKNFLSTSVTDGATDALFSEYKLFNLRSVSLTPYYVMTYGVCIFAAIPQIYNMDMSGWLNDTANKMDHISIFCASRNIAAGIYIIEGKNS